MLTAPPPSHFLQKVWLCISEQNCVTSLVYIRGMDQVNCKREWIGSPPFFLSFSIFFLWVFPLFSLSPLFFFCFLCLGIPAVIGQGPLWGLRTGDDLFSSLAFPQQIISYPILCTEFCCGSGEVVEIYYRILEIWNSVLTLINWKSIWVYIFVVMVIGLSVKDTRNLSAAVDFELSAVLLSINC